MREHEIRCTSCGEELGTYVASGVDGHGEWLSLECGSCGTVHVVRSWDELEA